MTKDSEVATVVAEWVQMLKQMQPSTVYVMHTMREEHFLLSSKAGQGWNRLTQVDWDMTFKGCFWRLLYTYAGAQEHSSGWDFKCCLSMCLWFCFWFYLMTLGSGLHWGQYVDYKHLGLFLQPAWPEPWKFSSEERCTLEEHTQLPLWHPSNTQGMFQHSWYCPFQSSVTGEFACSRTLYKWTLTCV